MTEASYICNFIKDHPDDWRERLADKQIKVKDDPVLPISIFNYEIMADFSDPVVQEARGIIINTETLDVAAWPFRKFGNSHESYADLIDWDSARVQEKVDGSIVKLWHLIGDQWMLSSNSCINASDAKLNSGCTVLDLIEETNEFEYLTNLIKNGELDEHNTYIFELVGPKNQVVIKYDKAQLYHIGTRNNETGEELGTGQFTGFIMSPKEYPLHSLEDCIAAAKKLNKNDYPDNEGFVVVDKDYHRVKIKAPEYLIYHHAVNNGQITKERAYEILSSDDLNMDVFLASASQHVKDAVLYYESTFAEVKASAMEMIGWVRQMAEDGKSRKEIALAIKDKPFSYFGFKALDKAGLSAEEIVKAEGDKYTKFVKEYDPNREDLELSVEEGDDIDL